MHNALIIIPAFNERRNLPDLLRSIHGEPLHADVLIIDDNSTDGTSGAVERMSGEVPDLTLLRRQGRRGLGNTLTEGLDYAVRQDYEYVFIMDADHSHDPRALGALYDAARESGGLAIGSRYTPGGRMRLWSHSRRVLSFFANVYVRGMLGLKYRDVTSGFRCYCKSAIKSIPLENLRARGFFFQVETLWHIHRGGHAITEVPIEFTGRRAGRSKLTLSDLIEGVRVSRHLMRFRRRARS